MNVEEGDLSRKSNNFDLVRLLAASFVVIGHSPSILLNKQLPWDPVYELLKIRIHGFGVLIFFIISGFLVTKSWESRKSILDFLAARVLRIFPALICVVLLSVFLLGLSLTKYSLVDYLTSEITLKYLQNMTLYRMYYYLPGVFETNPIGGSINGSLWTLPYEFTCYLFLALMGLLTILNNKWFSLLILVALTALYHFRQGYVDSITLPIIGIDFKTFFKTFLYFFSGSLFYQFRKIIPFHLIGLILCACIISLVKVKYLPDLSLVFTLPYLVFYFAFWKKIKTKKFEKHGDVSYGLYLYAFPVQQLIVYFLPEEIGIVVMIILSFLFTIPFALLSWKFIEKPALRIRQNLFSSGNQN